MKLKRISNDKDFNFSGGCILDHIASDRDSIQPSIKFADVSNCLIAGLFHSTYNYNFNAVFEIYEVDEMKKSIPINPMPDDTCRTIKYQYGQTSTDNLLSQGTFGASGVVHIQQATAEGQTPCKIGGGGRLELSQQQDTKRASNRERRDKSNSDNGEYP